MEKPKELLIIDPPNELKFCGPFTRPVITVMKLTNPTEHTILFKIKTTAPKRYCVRPNFGVVAPHSNTKVEICLQAFVYDANEKNKHKFMVQSLIAPEGVDDYGKLWRVVEPDQLMDAKLKCVFEMPATVPPTENSAAVFNEVISKEVLPKTLGDEKFEMNFQPVDQTDKITAEIQQLRDEGSELRKENLNLKEQIIRLRCSSNKQTMNEPYSPMVEKQIPMLNIALAIAAAIIGILLGKFLL